MLKFQRGSNGGAWFGDIDEKIFTFRHKVNNCLKEALEVQSKILSRSSFSSNHSSKSSKSRSSIKEKATQEKLQVVEFLFEAAFLENKKTAQYQADESRVQEKLAKAKARIEISDSEKARKQAYRNAKKDVIL